MPAAVADEIAIATAERHHGLNQAQPLTGSAKWQIVFSKKMRL
jgi:hypothetical protein